MAKQVKLVNKKRTLRELLEAASAEDLKAIVALVLDEGNVPLLRDESRRNKLAAVFPDGPLHEYIDDIAYEIRALGSVGVANLFRDGDQASYSDIVKSVAKKLGVKFDKSAELIEIESALLDAYSEIEIDELTRYSETVFGDAIDKAVEKFSDGKAAINGAVGSFLHDKVGMNKAKANKVAGLATKAAVVVGGAAAAVAVLPASAGVTAVGAVAVAAKSAAVSGAAAISSFSAKGHLIQEPLTKIIVALSRVRRVAVKADKESFKSRLKECML